jgi:hypothetical protein
LAASRKFGIHKSASLANARTLKKAKYHIRTELGISHTSYTHSDEFPIYGTGQGSGNSPSQDLEFFLSLLFVCYNSLAHQDSYCNPDCNNFIHLNMIGFVDDCKGQVSLFFSSESKANLHQLVEKADQNAATWSHLLIATIGSLELSS